MSLHDMLVYSSPVVLMVLRIHNLDIVLIISNDHLALCNLYDTGHDNVLPYVQRCILSNGQVLFKCIKLPSCKMKGF